MMTTAPQRKPTLSLILALVTFVAILGGAAWFARPDGHLHVFFLDTPGDAVLVQTPHGHHVLLDGGSDPALLTMHLGQRLPFWKHTLDAVILTADGHDRLPGQVAALARYRAAVAFAPPQLQTSATAEEWVRLNQEQNTPLRRLRVGEQFTIDNVGFTALASGTEEESGLVLRLDYGTTQVVFHTADGSADAAALQANAQPVTALAYPWQRPLNTPLLVQWQPQMIVFTSAHEEDVPVLLSYAERKASGAAVFHEKNDGTVELVSDGRRAWVGK